MSTSLLYHAFGIREYIYVRTSYEHGHTIFEVEPDLHRLRCPVCRSRNVTRKGQGKRRFRMEPIGKRQSFLDVAIQRVACAACGTVRQVNLPFADPRRTYTRRFERYALELSRVVEAGLSDQEVSAITGHRSMQMLRRYTHLRGVDLVKRLA